MAGPAPTSSPDILRFELEGQCFGVLASAVRELFRVALPSPLPQAPEVVLGVLDVRGETLPVYDTRFRFGLPRRELTASDAMLVVDTGQGAAVLVVDNVLDLVRATPDSIEPLARHGERARGVARLEDGCLVIVDLDAFLSAAEHTALSTLLAAPPTAGA